MATRHGDRGFESYLDVLSGALGHADRAAGLKDYCRGLLLPLERKSIEPLAAYVAPEQARARHQALHHFVAKSEWSDVAVLERVRAHVAAQMDLGGEVFWIVDDTGFRKKGRHSVGVARQYCGEIGKQDNCQVAVSLSLATAAASVPMAWQLYLPEEWAQDMPRRTRAGVPVDLAFATKPEIALAQIRQAVDSGVPLGIVLADAAYGTNTQWRDGLVALELQYGVGVVSSLNVWAPGTAPVPPAPWSGQGRPPVRHRRDSEHMPVSVKTLAQSLDSRAFRSVQWREGSNAMLSSRFAAVRVRAAQGDRLRPEEWLVIEWPKGDAEPFRSGYRIFREKRRSRPWSTLSRPAGASSVTIKTSNRNLVSTTTKAVDGVAFITTPPCASPPTGSWSANGSAVLIKKNRLNVRNLPYPTIASHEVVQRAQRHVPDSIATLRWLLAHAICDRFRRVRI